MLTPFHPGPGPLGLDIPLAVAALATGLVALGAASALVIGAGRMVEALGRRIAPMLSPAASRWIHVPAVDRIGDPAHRHQVLVGQTLAGDARVPGLCLFFASLAGILVNTLGASLASLMPWATQSIGPTASTPGAFDFAANPSGAFLLSAIAVATLFWNLLAIAGSRALSLLPALFLRIPFAIALFVALAIALDPAGAARPLLVLAVASMALKPVAILARGLRILGPLGFLWAPAAILGWALEIVFVAAWGPLASILRRMFAESALAPEIGAGVERIRRLSADSDTVEHCFAVDTLEGMRRPG